MGWSAASAACATLDAIQRGCAKINEGSQNVFLSKGIRYFFEPSRTEHRDGAITGAIFRFLDDNRCRRVGSFRIEPDGAISRAPREFLRLKSEGAQR